MERSRIINKISEYLAILKYLIVLRSSVNLLDLNIHSEQFFKILLNKIYGYSLENINIEQQNAAVIDLGDKKNKIAIQVTSNDSLAKIKSTVDAFEEKEFFKIYDSLKILIIRDKTPREGEIKTNNFSFDKSADVIDINDLFNYIVSGIDDLEKLEEIKNWLETELFEKYKSKNKSNEVETFLKLISFISDENNYAEFKSESEPDPEYKIEQRFKDYAPQLKNRYVELAVEYRYALSVTENGMEISSVKIRRIGNYLKEISKKHLKSNNNDPEEALDNLCGYFKGFFIAENINFDELAIKFYLIHQLIQCNVFPNE
ncbi:hypothetical protein OA88_14520 [Flavobacterium sp. JRM]|nr:hypothetical protein OA88_14520 [Flavobacterium sp. JRM]